MKPDSPASPCSAAVLLRVVAVVGFWLGAYLLVANLLESFRDFDPSYLGYFFTTVLLRPLLLMFWSLLLWLLAPSLSRRIERVRSR